MLNETFQVVSEASVYANLSKLQGMQLKEETVVAYSNMIVDLISELEGTCNNIS